MDLDAGLLWLLVGTVLAHRPTRLATFGYLGHMWELYAMWAWIAAFLADAADRKVIVAGSVGPTGEIMEPVGALSHSLAVEMFHETADGLKSGGADVGWLETISAPEEFRAAAETWGIRERPKTPWSYHSPDFHPKFAEKNL